MVDESNDQMIEPVLLSAYKEALMLAVQSARAVSEASDGLTIRHFERVPVGQKRFGPFICAAKQKRCPVESKTSIKCRLLIARYSRQLRTAMVECH